MAPNDGFKSIAKTAFDLLWEKAGTVMQEDQRYDTIHVLNATSSFSPFE